MDEQLRDWLEAARSTTVDVEVAGRICGSKMGESPQRPRAYRLEGDTLVIDFEPTEKLTVLRPSAVELSDYADDGFRDVLVIPAADEVRWGWHFYGRPQTSENWCVHTYQFDGELVEWRYTGPRMPVLLDHERFPRRGTAAVRLIPFHMDRILRWRPWRAG